MGVRTQLVIPATAGIQAVFWIPVVTGMTRQGIVDSLLCRAVIRAILADESRSPTLAHGVNFFAKAATGPIFIILP